MELDDLKLKDLKKSKTFLCGEGISGELLSSVSSIEDHPYEMGRNYFIRTVTMIQIGKLVQVTPQELVLEKAVWCADTGRFTQALLEGDLNEVELFPSDEKVIIGRGALVDACPWKHKLPEAQK